MEKINLTTIFPEQDYVPFGYIDNPHHSMVLNRSGVIRSVPPIGFGFWTRGFSWLYSGAARREINYLSFLNLSINVDGESLHFSEDFEKNDTHLVSRYHTKLMMSYDWVFKGMSFSAKYYLDGENSLICLLEIVNKNDEEKSAIVHATNIYGYPETNWWGCNGIAASADKNLNTCVSKLWAYGDVFVLGADLDNIAFKSTSDENEWNKWMTDNNISSNKGGHTQFPGCMHAVQSYQLNVPAGQKKNMMICMARGVNEKEAQKTFQKSINNGNAILDNKLCEDNVFYENTPLLTGDWPESWKQGWIYDFETLRMNVRPPLGIFKHHWDGMQVFSPRSVLGEAALDMMCLSYADANLAKDVLYGTFADAPAPNVPCTREDGSMNMVGTDGSECGSSPVWGLPFHVIRSIYMRDRDEKWITDIYPHLKAYVEWWLENRTDKDGWFFCRNSWESGQDGSERFKVVADGEGDPADFVRTVDVESAMANAITNLALFADIAGHSEDKKRWEKIQDEVTERTQKMFVDGSFRDFDGRSDEPIILNGHFDVMMLLPVSLGIATDEQIKEIIPLFNYFRENPKHWLEWPSFMFPFSEAAWNAGQREFIAEVITDTGNRIYQRTSENKIKTCEKDRKNFPDRFNYRIPGVANEYWPVSLENQYKGCENYGWGATLPTLIIRNIIGFRENNDPFANEFILSPMIPSNLAERGKSIGIKNVNFHGIRINISCILNDNGMLNVTLSCESEKAVEIKIYDNNNTIATSEPSKTPSVSFDGPNGKIYHIKILNN